MYIRGFTFGPSVTPRSMEQVSLSTEERELLDKWLPYGWLTKAVKHFRGKHSRTTIHRAKAGQQKRLNWTIINYLLKLAMENKERAQKAADQLSTLRA